MTWTHSQCNLVLDTRYSRYPVTVYPSFPSLICHQYNTHKTTPLRVPWSSLISTIPDWQHLPTENNSISSRTQGSWRTHESTTNRLINTGMPTPASTYAKLRHSSRTLSAWKIEAEFISYRRVKVTWEDPDFKNFKKKEEMFLRNVLSLLVKSTISISQSIQIIIQAEHTSDHLHFRLWLYYLLHEYFQFSSSAKIRNSSPAVLPEDFISSGDKRTLPPSKIRFYGVDFNNLISLKCYFF